MPSSRSQSYPWLLGFLSILSVWALVSSKRKGLNVSEHEQDTLERKAQDVPQYTSPGQTNSAKTTGSKSESDNVKDWAKISAIAQACAVPLALGLVAVNTCQMRAARQANVIAEESFIASQRAYVSHRGFHHEIKTITNPSGKNVKHFEFNAKWENTGSTSAVGVVSLAAVSAFTSEISEQEFMGKGLGFPPPTLVDSIGARMPSEVGPLRQPENFATEDPEYHRFFWGWIVYRDIFPKTKIHLSEFCSETTSITPKADGDYDFNATACTSGHNCVDEFCPDYAAMIALYPYK